MNDREKKLLTILLIAGFLILNVAAVKLFFQPRVDAAKSKTEELKKEYESAQEKLDERHKFEAEMNWLDRTASEPMTSQDAVSRLNNLVTTEARKHRLELSNPTLDEPLVDDTLHFHRARMRVEVSGKEKQVFGWLLSRLTSPDDLRMVTSMRIEGKRNDPHSIDCLIEIEQWFLPEEDTPPEA